MKILNLTQHVASAEQVEQGVVELSTQDKAILTSLITFDELPAKEELFNRASQVVELVDKYNATHAMIGGAPYFMTYLESALAIDAGIVSVYAFSKRISNEYVDESGHTHKTMIFKHQGFVGLETASDGCIYCGSNECVAYTHGESVCG